MNIAQIMDLDVGMKNITCSGKVAWANEPKNIKGTSGSGNDYDFWSQFIVIEDSSGGKIGVSITVEADQSSVKKGDMVTVEKAELKEYVKNGESMLKLQGKLQYPTRQSAPQSPQQPAQRPNVPQAQDTKPHVRAAVRLDILCAMLSGGIAVDYPEVSRHTEFVISGKIAPDVSAPMRNNPDYVGDDPPAPVDDDIPY